MNVEKEGYGEDRSYKVFWVFFVIQPQAFLLPPLEKQY